MGDSFRSSVLDRFCLDQLWFDRACFCRFRLDDRSRRRGSRGVGSRNDRLRRSMRCFNWIRGGNRRLCFLDRSCIGRKRARFGRAQRIERRRGRGRYFAPDRFRFCFTREPRMQRLAKLLRDVCEFESAAFAAVLGPGNFAGAVQARFSINRKREIHRPFVLEGRDRAKTQSLLTNAEHHAAVVRPQFDINELLRLLQGPVRLNLVRRHGVKRALPILADSLPSLSKRVRLRFLRQNSPKGGFKFWYVKFSSLANALRRLVSEEVSKTLKSCALIDVSLLWPVGNVRAILMFAPGLKLRV